MGQATGNWNVSDKSENSALASLEAINMWSICRTMFVTGRGAGGAHAVGRAPAQNAARRRPVDRFRRAKTVDRTAASVLKI